MSRDTGEIEYSISCNPMIKGPVYERIDQPRPYDKGRRAFRSLLMRAMFEDASRISIQPHKDYPTVCHQVMKFLREKPIHTLSPDLDDLIPYLAALPNNQFRLKLNDLVDEFLLEFRPVNEMARQRIDQYRAASRKTYSVSVSLDVEKRTAEMTLKPVK